MYIGKANVRDKIAEIEGGDIKLFRKGDNIGFKAEKGKITPEIVAFLKENKNVVLQYLDKREEPLENFYHVDEQSLYEPFDMTEIQTSYSLGKDSSYRYGGLSCQGYFEYEYENLDVERAQDAWNEVIKNHYMLHTYFYKNGTQVFSKDFKEYTIQVNDLRNQYSDSEFEKIVKRLSSIKFDSEKEFPYRIEITKLNQKDILHFVIEFIIADWTSASMFMEEFEDIYFGNGKNTHKEGDANFRNYQLAYADYKDSIKYSEDKLYWENNLVDFPSAPELPLKNINSSNNKFKRFFMEMKEQQYLKFKENAKNAGITPTILLLSAYALTLNKWSSNKKFALNLTLFNRIPFTENVMDISGDFTTTTLLDFDFEKTTGFIEFAKNISSKLNKNIEHNLFSGVEIIQRLKKKEKNILMPFIFTGALGYKNKALRGKITDNCISQTPQVLIDCQAKDDTDGLKINWDIRDGVFEEDVISDMFEEFKHTVFMFAQIDNFNEIDTRPILPEAHLEIIKDANNTSKKLNEHLLHSRIIEQYQMNPDKIAVIHKGNKITYKELVLKASSITNDLKKLNVSKNECIGVAIPKSEYQVFSVLGILGAGCVYVPVDCGQAIERKKTILKNAGIKVLITLSTIHDTYSGIELINADECIAANECSLACSADLDAPAYIIHTSGSTGVPKGVVISHRGAVNTIEDINERYHVSFDDTALGLSQLYFDLSVYDIFGLLSVGGTIVYPESERYTDPSYWHELVMTYNITIWNSVPAFMKMFTDYIKSNNLRFPDIKSVMLSGDWIPLDLFEDIKKLNSNVKCTSLGGATEASIWSIYYDYEKNEASWTSIPYGKPLANQKFYVLDDNFNFKPLMTRGELYIGGAGLAIEYLGNKEETDKHFIVNRLTGERLYRTGDLGRVMPDGNIEFLGRADTQVKVLGYRIELGEIDSNISEIEGVEISATVTIGENEKSKKIYSCIKLSEADFEEQDIKDKLSLKLPEYMIPKKIFIVDEMPLTSNGKIDRKEIIKMIKQKLEEQKNENANNEITKTEKLLMDIWTESLNISSMSLDDDFYDLGADSLVIGSTASKIKKAFNDQIPYEDIMITILNESNIRQLAKMCEEYK